MKMLCGFDSQCNMTTICNNLSDALFVFPCVSWPGFDYIIFRLGLVKHVFPTFSRNAKISISSYEI